MKLLRILPFVIMLLLAALLAFGLWKKNPLQPASSPIVGQSLPAFSLPVLISKKTFSPDMWKGNVVVLNVFASWCEPCAIEAPVMMKLAQSGVAVYGIAWKDRAPKVAAWLGAHKNPYTLVGVDERGQTTIPLGLSGVPETFVIDKNGQVAAQYKTAITDEMLNGEILPLIGKLNAQ